MFVKNILKDKISCLKIKKKMRRVFAILGFLLFQMNLQIALVSEDGLVSHQWKERPICLANFICLSTWERQGQEVGVGG
jgi:hypothetical protein